MSGTFNDISVPPTLVSFAVDVATDKTVVTPELKAAGNRLVLFTIKKDAYDLPDYHQVMDLYRGIHESVKAGTILSAYAVCAGGVAEAVSKMAFGNWLGVKLTGSLSASELFAP